VRSSVRTLAPWALLASGAALLLARSGLLGFALNDYDHEAAPAYLALVHGHVGDFLARSPAYGGSLIIRSPFALLPSAWGGGELAVFRAAAAPCLLAGVVLGLMLVSRLLAAGVGRGTCAIALLLCSANPLTLRALDLGHPEELLGAGLCVAAVLLAGNRRPVLAGVLLGLAISNKAWALLAIGPVLLALPDRRTLALLVAGGVAAAIMAPLFLFAPHAAQPQGAGASGVIFQPWQVWWPLGSTGEVVRGFDGNIKVGYRAAPLWLSPITHPLIVAVAVPLSLLWARRAAGRPWEDALLLLALLFLLRCVLDPWNTSYYALPCVMSLLAWEVLRFGRAPVLSLAVTMVSWATWQWLPPLVSPDIQSLLYLGWSLPLVGFLGWRLYAPALPAMPTLSSGGRASVWSTTQ
jgi:hypothetical protein